MPAARCGRLDLRRARRRRPAAGGPQRRARRPADRDLPAAGRLVRDRRRLPAPGRAASRRDRLRPLRHLPAARPALPLRTGERQEPPARACATYEVRERAGCSSSAGASLTDAHWSRPREHRVRTQCPYCGVGCGLLADVEDGRLARPSAATGTIPPTAGATCRKPLGLPFAVHAPDRATVPLWRADRDARFEQAAGWEDVLGTLAGRRQAIVARARPGRHRVLHLRPAADRGLLRDQQARQGLSRDEQRRLQLAAVHVLGRRGLQRRVRLRRPAAGLRGHRARRLLPAARDEHRRLPPDPLVAHPRPPGRGRVRHLRRPARDADRARLGPAPAGPPRHGPRAAERDAARHRARRPARRLFVERHTSGWRGARRGAREWPPARAAEVCGVARRAHRAGARTASPAPARRWRCGRWAPTSRRSGR